MQGVVAGRQAESRPAYPQEQERFGDHRDTEHDGHSDEAADVPGFRLLGWPDIVGGKGYLREVRHEDQQQHCEGGDDELAGCYERDGHEGRFQDGAADLVDDPGQDALVDRPPLLDQGHDVRQPRFGQDDTRGTLGHIRGAADGDADFGLTQRGGIIDPVARHAGHMSRRLEVLHHDIFVLRKDLRETICARQQVHRLVVGLCARGLQVRHAPYIGQSDPSADFTRYWRCVPREHLHWNTQVQEFGDQLLGIRPGRIVQGHQSHQGEGTVLGSPSDREGAIALGG